MIYKTESLCGRVWVLTKTLDDQLDTKVYTVNIGVNTDQCN